MNTGSGFGARVRVCMRACVREWASATSGQVTHPQYLSADVGAPLLLQRAALGVLDEVCDRAGSTELHHQLQGERRR